MGIGGLGIGDWGLGIGANPQSPIPRYKEFLEIFIFFIIYYLNFIKENIYLIKIYGK